jgi:hypothetical protein
VSAIDQGVQLTDCLGGGIGFVVFVGLVLFGFAVFSGLVLGRGSMRSTPD